jgi:capsular polysaccharide biosynthesis protein
LVDAGWSTTNRRVFIRRGGGSPRRLINEADVMAALSLRGFTVVDPQALSPEEVARACFGADVVVGVEGSHLAHGLMQMRPGAALVTIQPPDRFNNPFKDFCDASGLTYGFVVAEAAGEGFRQHIEGLARILDRLS